MKTRDLDFWKTLYGVDIAIGQKVRIEPDYEYYDEWREEYPIVGIQLDPKTGELEISLLAGDEVFDEWEIKDLILAQ